MGKIYNIPLPNNYLQELAKIIVNEQQISKVFLPNNRSCRDLKKELRKFNCISPAVISISDLISFPNINFIPAKFLRERLNDISLSTLYDLSSSLTTLIKELILNRADYRQLIIPSKFNENWKHTLSILDGIFATSEIVEVKKNLEYRLNETFVQLNQENILIAGLPEFNFYTKKLYRIAQDRGIIVIRGAETPDSKNYKKIKKFLKIDKIDSNNSTENHSRKQREIIVLKNISDEATAVAIAVKKFLALGRSIMIVCPNFKLVERLKFEFLKWNIHADNSFKQPFYKTISGQILAQIISVLENNFCNRDVINLFKYNDLLKVEAIIFEYYLRCKEEYSSDFFRTFSDYKAQKLSNFSKNDFKRSRNDESFVRDRYVMEDGFRASNGCLNEKIFFNEFLTSDFVNLARMVERLFDFVNTKKKASFSYWTNYFAGFLELIRTSAKRELMEILKNFQENQFNDISLEDFCAFIKNHLLPIYIDENSEYNSNVTIVGILESQLLDADFTVICNANENSWKANLTADFWMSDLMLKQLHINTQEDKKDLYDCIWEKLISRSDFLITRSIMENGERTQAINCSKVKSLKKAEWLEKIMYQITIPSAPTKIPEVSPCPPLKFRPSSFWFSDLDLLINNPYVFYAKKILNLKEMNQIDETRNVRGNLIHKILDLFVKSTTNKKDFNKLKEISEFIVKKKSIKTESLGLWYFSMNEIFKFFIEHIDNNSKSYPEIKGSIILPVSDESNTTYVQISAKADRLDIDKSGNISIIDYKTGEAPSIKSVKEGKKVQLPIEALIAKQNGFGPDKNIVNKMYFWQLKSKDMKISEVSKNTEETDKICESILEQLKNLIIKYNYKCESYCVNIEDKYNQTYMHLARVKEIYDA